jgi:U3 small nucleolar RNA-associated protein 6
LDGLYATNDVEKGTIIFEETNMPDCELHRSATNPNCEVVELEDGTSAVVSCRPIAAGEFLCVPESSDEEEEEFEEDEDSFEEEEEDE